ncbi:MAG: hypothetical protein ACJ75L_00455 [Gaiellaceae bacterium]
MLKMTTIEWVGSRDELAPPVGTRSGEYRYERDTSELISYKLRLPNPAPPELRVTLAGGPEGQGWWMRIDELDITAEGADALEAFRNLLSAARAWLSYLKENEPDLADDLVPQARYVALLEAPVFSWFRRADISE